MDKFILPFSSFLALASVLLILTTVLWILVSLIFTFNLFIKSFKSHAVEQSAVEWNEAKTNKNKIKNDKNYKDQPIRRFVWETNSSFSHDLFKFISIQLLLALSCCSVGLIFFFSGFNFIKATWPYSCHSPLARHILSPAPSPRTSALLILPEEVSLAEIKLYFKT